MYTHACITLHLLISISILAGQGEEESDPFFCFLAHLPPPLFAANSPEIYVAHTLDAALYLFLPLYMALVLRLIQGRQVLARIGKRTLVRALNLYPEYLQPLYLVCWLVVRCNQPLDTVTVLYRSWRSTV